MPFTPYSTVAPYFQSAPGWIPSADTQRIQSYQVYEEIFWNNPDTYRLILRDPNRANIYIPNARILVETTNRYVATGFNFQVEPGIENATAQDQILARQQFENLFRRERFFSNFHGNKLFGIIRGDWLWHITADPTKPAGTRIKILPVDPASYFPIYDDDDPDRLVRVHLAEEFVDNEGNNRVRRQTYEREQDSSGNFTGRIISSLLVFEPDQWFRTNPRTIAVEIPPTVLPPQITSIPVYHIKNFSTPGDPFGSSDLRGLERIMASVNQGISDEDIALALEGLGIYATESGSPVDASGAEVPWILGPGRVIENAKDFRRVNGVGSVQPYQDHLSFLTRTLREAAGTPDVAIGRVDVESAESGVALQLQMGPMLSKAAIRDQEILDVHGQMFFDLRSWFAAYEGVAISADVIPVVGDKLPRNRTVEVAMCTELVEAGVMSRATARAHLEQYGFRFDPNEAELISAEESGIIPSRLEEEAEGDSAE